MCDSFSFFVRVLAAPLGAMLITGCVMQGISSGISTQDTSFVLPQSIPARVAVVFQGTVPLDAVATDEFSTGLISLGFQVCERRQLKHVLEELAFSRTDLVSPDEIVEIGRLLGVQGVFVGTITSEKTAFGLDTHLHTKLVDIESGRILWSASSHDPRHFSLSMALETSMVYTARESLKLLRADLVRQSTRNANKMNGQRP